MIRLIAPLTLIIIAIIGFFALVNPIYKDIGLLKAQVVSYNEALDNSKALEQERDKLTKKYNSIDPVNLDKLSKLIPDNVDNIRLILEIEKIASPYGMILKDVKYDTIQKKEVAVSGEIIQAGTSIPKSAENYGTWNLEFSTEGSYNNFLNFMKDLESNLRIVDIASIQFSSTENTNQGGASAISKGSDFYKYGFKVKTYWLKN
ncbi:MAG: hypothetical protein KBD52_03570 [Candidatus Pacebacteria bacterium]|nr:hypothetical protein [Candidatus Paceibacterota bacterium]